MHAGGEHHRGSIPVAAVGEVNPALADGPDIATFDPQRPRRMRQQPGSDGRRVDDGVAAHAQRTRQAVAQCRLLQGQCAGIQPLTRDAGRGEPRRLRAGRGKAGGGGGFASVFGFGQPERAAARKRRVLRQPWRPGFPQRQRCTRERELGRVVVHQHEVAHAGGGGGGACRARIDHRHVQALEGEPVRHRGSDDAAADDDDVAAALQNRMPQAKGSSSAATISVVSAITWARPRIVGMIVSRPSTPPPGSS